MKQQYINNKQNHHKTLCSSRKSIPTPWKIIANSEWEGGGGSLKAKFLEAMYENKLEFPGGRGGSKQKTFCEGVWIFSGTNAHFPIRTVRLIHRAGTSIQNL